MGVGIKWESEQNCYWPRNLFGLIVIIVLNINVIIVIIINTIIVLIINVVVILRSSPKQD